MALYPSPNPAPQYEKSKPRILTPPPVPPPVCNGVIRAAGLLLAVGITMAGFSTPVKATPVLTGATLTVTGGGPSTFDMGAGLSRSNGIAQPATIKIKPVATASVATARLPGAFLGGKVALTGLTRSNGVGTAQLSTHFPTTQIGTGLSLANGRALASSPKSLLTPAPSRATDRLRSSLNVITYATPVRDTPLATAQLSTHFPTTSIGTGVSRDTSRLRATGIVMVSKATPVRVSARLSNAQFAVAPNLSLTTGVARDSARLRASLNLFAKVTPSRDSARVTGTIRFVGAGFDMGQGISRADSRLRATAIRVISYATPVRSGTLRMWGPPSLWYSSQPIAASGRAWAAGPLGMVGQQYLPDYSRASGGRVFSVHIRLMSAVAPIDAHPRMTAFLQFTGGVKVQAAGLSRNSNLANGQQLQVTQTNRIALEGSGRSNGLLTGAPLKQYYHVTPSKLDPLLTAWLHTHHEVAPIRNSGLVKSALLTASLKQSIEGLTRQHSRLPGVFLKIKPALVGVIVSDSRLRAQQLNSKLVLSLAPTRGTPRASCAALQFTGGSTITLGPAPVRADSRLSATLNVFYGTQPALTTSRLIAQLSSKQVLLGTIRDTPRLFAPLGFTLPTTVAIEGRIRSQPRLTGFAKTINAGGKILSGSGRLSGIPPTFAVALTSRTLLHPRATAVLQFTGGFTIQLVPAPALGDSRVFGTLKTIYRASPSRAQARTLGALRTITPLRGTTLETALLTGAFANPYEEATSLNACRVSCAFLRSASPLSGRSRATGTLIGGLTVHGQVAARIFFAKNRVFVWLAHDRGRVISAKDRRFIFYAGGLA